MKKKLMVVATILGIMSLGACVDDKESDSVKDVRNAKTEQLKSIAALNNAKAESEKTLATANAALIAAQAEAIKVQNDLAKVEIDLKKVELEREKAALELQKEMDNIELQNALKEWANEQIRLENEKARLEAEKKNIATQLEIQGMQLEMELLAAQQNLLAAQQAWKAAQESADEQEKAKLQKLVDEYANAVNSLNSAKSMLFSLESSLLLAENDLIDTKELRADLLERNQKDIAANEAEIAAYKKYANYIADFDKTKLEYDAKSRDFQVSQDSYKSLNNAYILLRDDMELPSTDNVLESKYAEAVSKAFYSAYSYRIYTPYGGITTISYDWKSDYYYWMDYVREFEYAEMEKEVGDITLTYGYSTLNAVPAPDVQKLSTIKPTLDKHLADAKVNKKSASDYVTACQKDVTDLKKEWDDVEADEDATAWDKENAAANYRNALENLDYAKQSLEYQDEIVKKMEEQLATLATLMDNTAYTAYTKLVGEYNTAVVKAVDPVAKSYFTAETFYLENTMKIGKELNALGNILYGYNGTNMTADNLARIIADLEETNADLKADESYISSIANIEQGIEVLKANIEAQQSVVSVKQIYADNAKKALDAAMPKAE